MRAHAVLRGGNTRKSFCSWMSGASLMTSSEWRRPDNLIHVTRENSKLFVCASKLTADGLKMTGLISNIFHSIGAAKRSLLVHDKMGE